MRPIFKPTHVRYHSALSPEELSSRLSDAFHQTDYDWNRKLLMYDDDQVIRIEYVVNRKIESTPSYIGNIEVKEENDNRMEIYATFTVPKYYAIMQWFFFIVLMVFSVFIIIAIAVSIDHLIRREDSVKQSVIVLGSTIMMLLTAAGAFWLSTNGGYPSELSKSLEKELQLTVAVE